MWFAYLLVLLGWAMAMVIVLLFLRGARTLNGKTRFRPLKKSKKLY